MTKDGQRFLINTQVKNAEAQPMRVGSHSAHTNPSGQRQMVTLVP